MARASSDDPGSKAQGGELGWNERSGLRPRLRPGRLQPPDRRGLRAGAHPLRLPPHPGGGEEARRGEAAGHASPARSPRSWSSGSGPAPWPRPTRRRPLAALQKGTSLATQFPDKKDEDAAVRRAGRAAAGDGHRQLPPHRGDSIPRLGPSPDLQTDAFAADGPGPLPGLYRSGDSLVVAEVTAREKVNDATFAAKKDRAPRARRCASARRELAAVVPRRAAEVGHGAPQRGAGRPRPAEG